MLFHLATAKAGTVSPKPQTTWIKLRRWQVEGAELCLPLIDR